MMMDIDVRLGLLMEKSFCHVEPIDNSTDIKKRRDQVQTTSL